MRLVCGFNRWTPAGIFRDVCYVGDWYLSFGFFVIAWTVP